MRKATWTKGESVRERLVISWCDGGGNQLYVLDRCSKFCAFGGVSLVPLNVLRRKPSLSSFVLISTFLAHIIL